MTNTSKIVFIREEQTRSRICRKKWSPLVEEVKLQRGKDLMKEMESEFRVEELYQFLMGKDQGISFPARKRSICKRK